MEDSVGKTLTLMQPKGCVYKMYYRDGFRGVWIYCERDEQFNESLKTQWERATGEYFEFMFKAVVLTDLERKGNKDAWFPPVVFLVRRSCRGK